MLLATGQREFGSACWRADHNHGTKARMAFKLTLGAVSLAILGAVGAATAGSMISESGKLKPITACSESGSGPVTRRLIVVGESWAAGDRLFPELSDVVADRDKGHVVACSVGFSGKNSGKILENLSLSESIALVGGKPDNVVILTGVNDQIQNRGSVIYAHDARAIAAMFGPSLVVQIVSAPNINRHPPLSMIFRAKNTLVGWVKGTETNAAYSEALVPPFKASQVIPFNHFSYGQAVEPGRYAADGIHLTLPEFHKYGSFIGRNVTLE